MPTQPSASLLRFSFIEKGDEQVITYQADGERRLSGEDFGTERASWKLHVINWNWWATNKRVAPHGNALMKDTSVERDLVVEWKILIGDSFIITSLNFLKSSSSLPPPFYLSYLKDWVSSSSSGGIYGSGASQLVMGKLACFCWLKFKWAPRWSDLVVFESLKWVSKWVSE